MRQAPFRGINDFSLSRFPLATLALWMAAIPVSRAQNPELQARLAAGNVSTRIAWATGASPPPAIPCNTRLESMIPRVGANPQKSEVSVDSATHPR